MDQNKSALERAFELAKSGKFGNVSDVKARLVTEGYSTDQVTGRTLSDQLKSFIAAAVDPKAS